jgi:hypothetical protein
MRLLAAAAVGIVSLLSIWSPGSATPTSLERQSAGGRCVDVFRPSTGGAANSGGEPHSLVTADFNEDGRDDVAVLRSRRAPSVNATAVRVLLSTGHGELRSRPALVPVDEAWTVLPGEFTGDGHVDLVTVAQPRPMLDVLAGDGTGGIERLERPLPLSASAATVAASDLDHDGLTDVLISDWQQPGAPVPILHVLLGLGRGEFAEAPGSPLRSRGHVEQATTGDFNGDGSIDVALASQSDGPDVLLGDGTGTLRPLATPLIGSEVPRNLSLIAAADFNADRHPDLAVVGADHTVVHILLGDGTGRFRAQLVRERPFPLRKTAIAIGSFNGDRLSDLALLYQSYDPYQAQVRVLLSTRTHGLQEAPGSPEYIGVGSSSGLAAADLDGNQFDDLVFAGPATRAGSLPILLNSADRPNASDRIPTHIGMLQDRRFSDARRFMTTFGTPMRVEGSMACDRGALRGRRLALHRRVATHSGHFGPWRKLTVATIGRTNRVRRAVRTSALAEYQWRPGDRRRPALERSITVTVSVAQAVSVRVTDLVRGAVRPAHAGATVILERADRESEFDEVWPTVDTTRLRANSTFSFPVPRRKGTYRVRREADRAHALGLSATFRR